MDNREASLNDAISAIEWLRANPDIPLPGNLMEFQIYSWDSKEEASALARAFGTAEEVGG